MDGEKGGGVLLVHLERLDEISIRLSRSPFVRTGQVQQYTSHSKCVVQWMCLTNVFNSFVGILKAALHLSYSYFSNIVFVLKSLKFLFPNRSAVAYERKKYGWLGNVRTVHFLRKRGGSFHDVRSALLLLRLRSGYIGKDLRPDIADWSDGRGGGVRSEKIRK